MQGSFMAVRLCGLRLCLHAGPFCLLTFLILACPRVRHIHGDAVVVEHVEARREHLRVAVEVEHLLDEQRELPREADAVA